jgi:hypothetical protein
MSSWKVQIGTDFYNILFLNSPLMDVLVILAALYANNGRIIVFEEYPFYLHVKIWKTFYLTVCKSEDHWLHTVGKLSFLNVNSFQIILPQLNFICTNFASF